MLCFSALYFAVTRERDRERLALLQYIEILRCFSKENPARQKFFFLCFYFPRFYELGNRQQEPRAEISPSTLHPVSSRDYNFLTRIFLSLFSFIPFFSFSFKGETRCCKCNHKRVQFLLYPIRKESKVNLIISKGTEFVTGFEQKGWKATDAVTGNQYIHNLQSLYRVTADILILTLKRTVFQPRIGKGPS